MLTYFYSSAEKIIIASRTEFVREFVETRRLGALPWDALTYEWLTMVTITLHKFTTFR